MTTEKRLTAALYARVSTADQTTENQLLELRRYAEARGWTIAECVDHAVSGTQERRPALDKLMAGGSAAPSGRVGDMETGSARPKPEAPH